MTFNIPKKLHVGIEHWNDICTKTYPLAFMAYDNQTIITMKKWCDRKKSVLNTKTGTWEFLPNKENIYEFENIPTQGFKIVESISRWSTSNKWFRVIDPRGFKLEISASNLCNLILESTIINGLIQEECIWSRYSGMNVLIPINSKEYIKAISDTKKRSNGKIKISELITGHLYSNINGCDTAIYLGRNSNSFLFQYVWHSRANDNINIGSMEEKSSINFVEDLGFLNNYKELILENMLKNKDKIGDNSYGENWSYGQYYLKPKVLLEKYGVKLNDNTNI